MNGELTYSACHDSINSDIDDEYTYAYTEDGKDSYQTDVTNGEVYQTYTFTYDENGTTLKSL